MRKGLKTESFLPVLSAMDVLGFIEVFIIDYRRHELQLRMRTKFHRADMRHIRNEHDLMRDFDQECVGYLRNDEIRRILESCDLRYGRSHLKDNFFRCYEALVGAAQPASADRQG